MASPIFKFSLDNSREKTGLITMLQQRCGEADPAAWEALDVGRGDMDAMEEEMNVIGDFCPGQQSE